MKYILIGMLILGVGGGVALMSNKTTYDAPQTATSTPEVVEVEETYPDEVLMQAQEAENAVLRAYELEQDRMSIVEEVEAKKASHALYLAEQQERIDTIDKELKTY